MSFSPSRRTSSSFQKEIHINKVREVRRDMVVIDQIIRGNMMVRDSMMVKG